MSDPALDRQVQAIARPDAVLLKYHLLRCLVFPPLLVIAGPYYFFRYRTMRYKFTDDGISMSWGILFRREIIVNYARIQDIHLKSNLVERWLGLARILVQTASGSSAAEMSFANIQQVVVSQGPLQRLLGLADVKVQSAGGGGGEEGSSHNRENDMHLGLFHSVTNPAEIRDLILDRLRRYRESGLGDPEEQTPTAPAASATPNSSDSGDLLDAARVLATEARALRAALTEPRPPATGNSETSATPA